MPRPRSRPVDAPAREEKFPWAARGVPRARLRVRDTGFPAAVRLLARARAGDGDPGRARCECHGLWLGLHGGQVQHIIARGMGGTSLPVLSTVINAAVMCEPGHALAESRDPGMYERGFWRWSWETPGAAPLMLGTPDGGFTRWLTADGGYSATAPGAA